jgi:hypothetical protein
MYPCGRLVVTIVGVLGGVPPVTVTTIGFDDCPAKFAVSEAFPAAAPVTTPVDAFTVAVVGELIAHMTSPAPLSVVVSLKVSIEVGAAD